MRIFGLIFVLAMASLFLPSCKQAGGNRGNGEAVITFTAMKHDYGEIPFSGDGYCAFPFRNTGRSPLLLTHVKSTCGCTIPEWPREPIPAGEQGSIRVSYDTRRVGAFTKSIYVYSNASNGV